VGAATPYCSFAALDVLLQQSLEVMLNTTNENSIEFHILINKTYSLNQHFIILFITYDCINILTFSVDLFVTLSRIPLHCILLEVQEAGGCVAHEGCQGGCDCSLESPVDPPKDAASSLDCLRLSVCASSLRLSVCASSLRFFV